MLRKTAMGMSLSQEYLGLLLLQNNWHVGFCFYPVADVFCCYMKCSLKTK